MNSEENAPISPFLAVFVGCFSAFIFALFVVFCKRFFLQIKKKDTNFRFNVDNKKKTRDQRIDSIAFENCEFCNCNSKNPQIPCNCGFNSKSLNSNNNSNSISQHDPDLDSNFNNVLIFDRNSQKLNESLLDTVSIEKGFIDLSKINYFCQNSLDVASIDEIINDEDLIEEPNKNDLEYRLDKSENTSYEIISQTNQDEKSNKKHLVKNLSLNNDKLIKVVLKLHKNLPAKLHSQSIELINEKPSLKSKNLISLLRRASLNTGGLVRQKSFDLSEEEIACHVVDFSSFDENFILTKEFNRESDNDLNNETSSGVLSLYNNQSKQFSDDKLKEESLDKSIIKTKLMMNERIDDKNLVKEQQNNKEEIEQHEIKSTDSSSENYKSKENNENDYKTLWNLRSRLEAEVEKDLNDSYSDLSEFSTNLTKQTSTEITEEHELIKNVIQSSKESDQRLSKNDSGYKSIERKDYSIDSKTESIYRQYTGSSLSKEFSLGSISNQNISLCSNNSINLDVKNYKNQYSIREEPEDTNEQKITFV